MSKTDRTYFLNGKKRFPIVAIEGIDASGKSTVANALARNINGICIHTPPDEYSVMKKRFENNSALVVSRFLFCSSGLHESWEIASRIALNKPVIFDRYILSTLCYHKVLGEKHNIDFDFNSASELIFPPEPDLHIILNTPIETISFRAAMRKDSYDNNLEKDIAFQDKVLNRFLSSGNEVVNTLNKSLKSVVRECILIIDKCLNTNFINKSIKEASL